MFSKFCFIFFIFTVDSIRLKRQLEDEHRFTTDDDSEKKFMLIPSIGYEINDNPEKFNLILNGWYYQPLNSGRLSESLQKVITSSFQAALHFLNDNEKLTKEKKQERLEPFFVRDISDHKIQLKLSKSISRTISTDENGRFNEKLTVDSLNGLNIKNQMLKYIASDNDDDKQQDEGIIFLMKINKPYGCSIISDIDDTIKISEVPDKKKLIVNTFKNDFQAVPGMSDTYQTWQSLHKCLIHYVSAMPSQLYHVTQKFLNKEKFPRGSFHMRHLKLVGTNRYQSMAKVFQFIQHESSKNHKLTVIKSILDHAPFTQEFIMVGDSGEVDPEIYGEIARNYPLKIKMIFIRLVDGGRNDDNRFEIAFKDISNDKWKTFSDAKELPKKLYEEIKNNTNTLPKKSYEEMKNNAITLSDKTSSIFFILFFIFLYDKIE